MKSSQIKRRGPSRRPGYRHSAGKTLATIALSAITYNQIPRAEASVDIPSPAIVLPAIPRDYVAAHAAKLGVDADLAVCIAEHESKFQADALGDGDLICPLTGAPQRSRGLFQISDCWHPEVPDDIAFSVTSATEWALSRMKDGHLSEWSTYGSCKKSVGARTVRVASANFEPSRVFAEE
ncbi:MAG: hypothetical protein ABI672_16280 [Vicinamibacteria bacterium]